jgi:IS66 C-terminal element
MPPAVRKNAGELTPWTGRSRSPGDGAPCRPCVERATVLYPLVESCRLIGVGPFAYLRDVAQRVATHPMSRIGELTPRGCQPAALAALDEV